MKNYYLVKAFDISTWHEFHPEPCLFETLKEAEFFCRKHTKKTVIYSFDKVTLGKIEVN